jgi:hypothetical protein
MVLPMTLLLTTGHLTMDLLAMTNRLRISLHTTDLRAMTDLLTDLQTIIVRHRRRHLITAHLVLLPC